MVFILAANFRVNASKRTFKKMHWWMCIDRELDTRMNLSIMGNSPQATLSARVSTASGAETLRFFASMIPH